MRAPAILAVGAHHETVPPNQLLPALPRLEKQARFRVPSDAASRPTAGVPLQTPQTLMRELAHQQHAMVRRCRPLSRRILRHHILWSRTLRKFTNVSCRANYSARFYMWKSGASSVVNHYRAIRIPRSMKSCAVFL
jgi:hypothetical protein